MINTEQKIHDALEILVALGFPSTQINDRTALCLLGLVNVLPETPWADASDRLVGITPILDWVNLHYQKDYAPNTRETFRRFSMHQFCEAGLALCNPDKPDRPVNSPRTVYQVSPQALELLRAFGAPEWPDMLANYLKLRETLAARYAMERELMRVPVKLADDRELLLSPGEHSELIKAIVEGLAECFAPDSNLVYAGDTENKQAYLDADLLERLGVVLDPHGKMPDVVFYAVGDNRLFLVEAVTSHGPIDGKRRDELKRLFGSTTAELTYVTAFPDKRTMARHLEHIAWETEVWLAEAPTHMIRFNGFRF